MKKGISISEPYYKFSSPYGKATLHRDEWYVTRKLTKNDLNKMEGLRKKFYEIAKKKSLGHIIKFRNRDDYVIDQLYPDKRFKTLKGAINFLIKNEGKLVFCS